MSEFSLPLLAKKFTELDISQESVETVSFWMLHHRRHAASIVKYWSERFNISSDSRKLALLFVVNDILKSNKVKSKIYHKEFERVLPDALGHIAETCSLKQLFHQTRRMLSIWETQKYFQKDIIDKFWNSLEGDYNANCKVMANLTSNATENETLSDLDIDIKPKDLKKMFLAAEAPEPEELIIALNSLKNLPSSDKAKRTKISNIPIKDIYSFEERQQAEKYGKQLEKAAVVIDDYNERLNNEITKREKVDNMLAAYNAAETERITDLELKMQQVVEELERVRIVRQEIKQHRASFPDWEKYSGTQELPPLPKVQDLFKKP